MSRAAAAITTPVTNAAKQQNSKRSSRSLDRAASDSGHGSLPGPLAIGPSSGVDQLRLFKIDHPQSLVPWLGAAGLGAAASLHFLDRRHRLDTADENRHAARGNPT